MRVRLVAALCAVFAMALAACSGPAPAPAPTPSDVAKRTIPFDGDWGWVQEPTPMQLGVTHTQDSLNSSEPADARARGTAILSNGGAIWQNVHLMGFGTLNPEPSPGEYDWSSLDTRMQLVKDTGGKTVLTLCCSPDWMKGGPEGATDWDKLERAPLPEHFEDFAKLAAATVQRYPQVQRVLVWNELKGFYNDDQNRWDYEGYTALYNDVYKAVKAVRPDVQIGGPYAVITSLDPGQPDSSSLQGTWGVADQRSLDILDYWLAQQRRRRLHRGRRRLRHPAEDETRPRSTSDARSSRRSTTGSSSARSCRSGGPSSTPTSPTASTPGQSSPASAAADLATIGAMARSGAAGALKWGPQGSDSLKYAALWTDSTRTTAGSRRRSRRRGSGWCRASHRATSRSDTPPPCR